MFKYAVSLISVGLSCFAADLVGDVNAAAGQGDYATASSYIQAYETQRGQTPESILALSWLGRTALAQRKYDQADRYAQGEFSARLHEVFRR